VTVNEPSEQSLDALLAEIRACRVCEPLLADGVRPVLQASINARVLIAGQAPGTRVHNTGIPFNDPSGDRLRHWLGVDRDTFYDADHMAIVPMGFCFPGLDPRGGDKPPRKECAPLWRQRVMDHLPNLRLVVAVGQYAHAWHLGKAAKKNLTETVRAWRDYMPEVMPLPHPSWRNNAWLARNPWFEAEALPALRSAVGHHLREHVR
jgi:uracil-DNA glycosylase